MTVVAPLSAFSSLILLLRFSALIAFLSFAESYLFGVGKLLKQVRVWFLPSNLLEQPIFVREIVR